MIRYFYSLLFYVALPLILIRLWLRSRKAPAYGKRVAERFGFGPKRTDHPLWIHAVSVGETLAIAPLIKKIQQLNPDIPILVTTMTPTGAERVQAIFGDSVEHRYIPYDLPDAVHRFLNRVNPSSLVIVETELWPNLIHGCHNNHVPVTVANARLSERSARGYQKAAWLSKPMLNTITTLAAQDQSTADRFLQLGLPQRALKITGSIKFDTSIPEGTDHFAAHLKQQWGSDRAVIVAGSTHEGEDDMLLTAFKQIKQQHPGLLLVLVPRHPERFSSVYQLAQKYGFATTRRSEQQPDPKTEVYLGDTMGELAKLYATADIAFVGGSLVNNGGHNPLEPALMSKIVIMGNHTFNFTEICQQLEDAGGLIRVHSLEQLTDCLQELLDDSDQLITKGKKAATFVKSRQGALENLYQLVCNNHLSR